MRVAPARAPLYKLVRTSPILMPLVVSDANKYNKRSIKGLQGKFYGRYRIWHKCWLWFSMEESLFLDVVSVSTFLTRRMEVSGRPCDNHWLPSAPHLLHLVISETSFFWFSSTRAWIIGEINHVLIDTNLETFFIRNQMLVSHNNVSAAQPLAHAISGTDSTRNQEFPTERKLSKRVLTSNR